MGKHKILNFSRAKSRKKFSIITSTAERQAAVEFGKAAAVRPAIVGKAMAEISRDADVAEAMFELLETQRLADGGTDLTLVRAPGRTMLADLLAAPPQAAGKLATQSS